LLSLLSPCFTQPSFQTFSMLMIGSVARVCDCTITGMLQAAGLAGEWHHSRAHDFFARRCWDPDELGVRLLDFLVSVFVKQDAPIRLAVDDTLRALRTQGVGRVLPPRRRATGGLGAAHAVGQLLGRRRARRQP